VRHEYYYFSPSVHLVTFYKIGARDPSETSQRRKKREEAKKSNKTKKKNKTEGFHAFFQAINIPIIQEIWKDRCIDRNTPVAGERIVTEYDSLSKKVTQL
jgi:hypothetical protein